MTQPLKPLLVVDDDPYNRDTLSRRLRRAGYEVEVASSAKDAISMIERIEPEMLLLDNMMPEMSGLDLLRLLRATQSPSQLPVIMVTAMSESKDIAEALKLGANDYVTKPVDMQVALARIEAQLRRKKAEEDLHRSEERFALVMRGTNDGVWDWDCDTGEVFYNARWKSMLGYSEAEIGSSLDEWITRVHRDDAAGVQALIAKVLDPANEGNSCSHEHRLRCSDGSYRWVLCRASISRSATGQVTRVAGSLIDVSKSKARDPLTGLPNRLAFKEYVQLVLDDYRSGQGGLFAVLFIDLDRFKLINDSLGHNVGDLLLTEIAGRLAFAVRSARRPGCGRPDALARLGGDEFALVIENVENAEDARGIAVRLLQEINGASLVVGRELFVTASIGIAMGSREYSDALELIRDADAAMYRAKSLGKARCEIFDAEMREDAIFRLELENDLQRALSQNQLEVYYQPKVDVKNHRVDGFEALLRWRHPARGFIPPAQFIRIAEETGLIVPIGLWVLEEACRTTREWHALYPSDPPINIAVNLSVRQFRQPDLAERIQEILEKTGLTPGALHVEITESIVIDDTRSVFETLSRLKSLGINIKIDDFGTGYSSLKQLTDLPLDGLKIDCSFVKRLGSGGVADEMVRTIISLAENLSLGVVAEGVETLEQLNTLSSMGCHLVQGYYFSPALPQGEAQKFLAGAAKLPTTV